MHRAGTALAQAAAETRVVQSELVSQDVKERSGRIVDFDLMSFAVDGQRVASHDSPLVVDIPSSSIRVSVNCESKSRCTKAKKRCPSQEKADTCQSTA